MAKDLKKIIEKLLSRNGAFSSGDLARATGLSRQALHATIKSMVSSGYLVPQGAGRSRRYARAARPRRRGRPATPRGRTSPEEWVHFPIAGLQEDEVWKNLSRKILAIGALPATPETIAHFAFTEILNNAIDHSGSSEVAIGVRSEPTFVAFDINDEGIGMFEHVRQSLRLESDLDALLQLSKGKVTSEPERHSGEGLFFVSKAVDFFEVQSSELKWTVDNRRGDVAIAYIPRLRGTRVYFEIDLSKSVALKEFFDEYSPEQFNKTRLHMKMFQFGTRFISRSEAKRITQGLEHFESVILDFRGVESVGQGFVDEFFRVWAGQHPRTRLDPVNMSEAVEFMIRRGLPIDPLTGIANRRTAMDALEREVRNAREQQSPLTVVMFDIDRFKVINDTHGAGVGDEVLRTFAQLLIKKARTKDLVARVGGDEFLCILPAQTREAGLRFAETIAEALRAIVLENDVRWSVSAGVASLLGEESADALLSRADHELHRLRAQAPIVKT